MNRSTEIKKSMKGEAQVQYLVQMKITAQARPSTRAEGLAFFNEFIHPTLEFCRKLRDQRKILAGGTVSGAIGLALIVQAESARELDDLVTALPVWPLMETEVTSLNTFEDRDLAIQGRLSKGRFENAVGEKETV